MQLHLQGLILGLIGLFANTPGTTALDTFTTAFQKA